MKKNGMSLYYYIKKRIKTLLITLTTVGKDHSPLVLRRYLPGEQNCCVLEYSRTLRNVCIYKCLFCSHHVLCLLCLPIIHICCQRVKKLR